MIILQALIFIEIFIFFCFIFVVVVQPGSLAQVGGKFYNMMDATLVGKWGSPSSEAANVDAPQPCIEVVEPADAK